MIPNISELYMRRNQLSPLKWMDTSPVDMHHYIFGFNSQLHSNCSRLVLTGVVHNILIDRIVISGIGIKGLLYN